MDDLEPEEPSSSGQEDCAKHDGILEWAKVQCRSIWMELSNFSSPSVFNFLSTECDTFNLSDEDLGC